MLKTWILILTLAGSDGNAVHSVEGFSSAATCQQAGKVWLRANEKSLRVAMNGNLTAVCIERK